VDDRHPDVAGDLFHAADVARRHDMRRNAGDVRGFVRLQLFFDGRAAPRGVEHNRVQAARF